MKEQGLERHINPIKRVSDKNDLTMEGRLPKMSDIQSRSISIQTGVSLSTIRGLDLGEDEEELAELLGVDVGYVTGFNIQASAYFPLRGRLGARLGLGWVQKGFSEEIDFSAFFNALIGAFTDDPDLLEESIISTTRITSNYLSVPALLQFNPVSRVRILAGPVLSVFLGCSIKATTESDSETESVSANCDELGEESLNTFDISIMTGAGVDIPVSNRVSVSLDAIFDLGLSNVLSTESTTEDDIAIFSDPKYQGFRIVAGVSIPFGN